MTTSKERLQPPEARRGRKDPLLELPEGVQPVDTLTWGFKHPELGDSTLLLF